MDGNFSMAPNIYTQVYVIRAPIAGSYITCAYGLLPGKAHSDYNEFLQAVVDSCRQLGYNPDPSVIITDFEQALIRASRDVLGNQVHHQGCFYHLTQSTWRKVRGLYVSFFLSTEIVGYPNSRSKSEAWK